MTFAFSNYTNNEIEYIAKHLDSKATRSGFGWLTRCPAHQTKEGGNLSIRLGDNGKLLINCFTGCNYRDVFNQINQLCMRPHGLPNSHYQQEETQARRLSEITDKIIGQICQKSYPIQGTLAEKYLRSRGISIDIPDHLRFCPHLAYNEDNIKTYYPAMIAIIQKWPDPEVIAIHRTYLAPDGSGKALITSPKKVLGRYQGGAIQFGELNDKLILAEGIETALSLYEVTRTCTWAVISASGFKNLVLPPIEIVPEIIIAADNDTAGKKAAKDFCDQWRSHGYLIKVALPSEKGKDFNDLLLKK